MTYQIKYFILIFLPLCLLAYACSDNPVNTPEGQLVDPANLGFEGTI